MSKSLLVKMLREFQTEEIMPTKQRSVKAPEKLNDSAKVLFVGLL